MTTLKFQEDLIFWIKEREKVRIAKALGRPRPWTSDPVLQQYRFCNVRREDDKVTKWIHTNWLKPNADLPMTQFAMGIARMVNLPETLQDLGFPYEWDKAHFVRVLAARKAAGLKVWTNAYMITGGYSAGGESKEVIIGRVLDRLYLQLQHDPITEKDTLASAHEKVKVPGIGSFLGAQIIADLKHSFWLFDATDWQTWCSPGPGSVMGLNFLHRRAELANISPEQFMREVNEIRALIAEEVMDLDAQNVQNCLCEFSKYVRAKHMGRRLKQAYVPSP